jgi:hypothetical protein
MNKLATGDGYIVIEGVYAGLACVLVNVYAKCDYRCKRDLWNRLSELIASFEDTPCCIMGDFNIVRCCDERKGITISTWDMEAFDNFINLAGLIDLPLTTRRYSWKNVDGKSACHIDRFLLNKGWNEVWPGYVQAGLQRNVSDHCPLTLKRLQKDWGQNHFAL